MEDMVSWFKPTKSNVIGTVLLLVANWAGGFISRLAVPLLMGGEMSGRAAGNFAGRTGGFAGAAGTGGTQFAAFGLVSSAVSLVILALLFYIVLSVVVGVFAKPPAPEAEGKKKRASTHGRD